MRARNIHAFLFTAMLGGASIASDAVDVDDAPPSAFATVNAIDPDRRRIDVTHDPIPDINWPTMRMSLPVAESVDLAILKPGARIFLTLSRDQRTGWIAETIALLRPAP